MVIYTYMAHHQGMSLLALDNALHHNVLHRRFHSEMRVRAVEPLLYERIPAAQSTLPPWPRGESLRTIGETVDPAFRLVRPDTPVPRVQLMGNGSYSLMITNSGGGYSRWREFDITRWRADTTRDHWGSFLYIRDLRSGGGWSATFHPDNTDERSFTASFSVDRVEFSRRRASLASQLDVTVSPGRQWNFAASA